MSANSFEIFTVDGEECMTVDGELYYCTDTWTADANNEPNDTNIESRGDVGQLVEALVSSEQRIAHASLLNLILLTGPVSVHFHYTENKTDDEKKEKKTGGDDSNQFKPVEF
ncbi:hypothetical protein QR680_010326 [Steinernema hermaphroditum]|uniref:Uncharacterized protein n=1 Tax=Steinernema hermaphroditum TaxID=289476 RepID=A0AA39IQF7_9BILA|nr:hypothetical protein QR680_010326 [Steinernema hermaphroditum]